MGKLTAVLMLLCQIGFAFSYIVYVKISIPYIIEIYTKDETVLKWFGNNERG
jgi:hypothetical protein